VTTTAAPSAGQGPAGTGAGRTSTAAGPTTAAPTTAAPAAAVGERPPFDLSRVAQRDWALWVDWCAATGRDPHHGGIADLAVFLLELPATTGVQERRVRNIARTLGQAGHALPRPTTIVPVRVGPGWATHVDALAALRVEWYPEGVAARRDALILVLTAAGFTRRRITTLRPPQITTPGNTVSDSAGVTVDGVDLPSTADPLLCPRCALTRWAQVLGAFADRSRADVEDLLTAAREHKRPRHDCADPLEGRWRRARWVIPAIDRHGAIQPMTPLTARAVTGILARRYNTAVVPATGGGDQPDHPTPQPTAIPTGHRPGRAEQEELNRLWKQAEQAADELNARILQLLADL